MKLILAIFSILTISCNNEKGESTEIKPSSTEKEETQQSAADYDLEIYDYDGLEPLINKMDDKIHVVNFWATWCGPCIKELPYFEAVNKAYKNNGVEVLLVSLDFPRQYDTKLKPYIETHKIESKVVAFDDTDQNRWIPAIDKNWSGAIPATIIYKGDKRKFYEKSFTKEELETEIKQFIN